MDKSLSRKEFIRKSAKFTAGAAAGITGLSLMKGETAHQNPNKIPSWPWPYTAVDPDSARRTAHEAFYRFGCCYAGFAGILIPLREKVGEPFSLIPLEMMSYGGGGVKGWGTLCGTLNGAAAAVSLVLDHKTSSPLIHEIMSWYSEALFPTDISNNWAAQKKYAENFRILELAQSKSGSPLCHVSVTGWCVASGFAIGSPEQRERCARLSSDVAAKTVELLNSQAAGRFKPNHASPASGMDCLDCHGPEGEIANVDAHMDCAQCHGNPHEENPGK